MSSAAIGELHQRTGPDDRRTGRRVTTGLRFGGPPALYLDGLPAEIIDLSITGARVAVETTEGLVLGTTVRVVLDGGAGTCIIRWVEASRDRQTTYGIEFVWLDQDLNEMVHDLVVGDRGSLDERWRYPR